ncbi:MAG: M56 family metallopeptidase, partial [Pirellulaceae bacterium]
RRLYGVRGAVRVVTTDRTEIPLTVGLGNSTIILPVESLSWTSRRLEMVLAHEWAHVERRDVAWNMMGRIACGLAWFNPTVWFVARRMVFEREQACDDRVVSAGFPPSEYAAIMLQFARELTGKTGTLAGAVSMADPPLAVRIRAILAPRRSRDRATWRQRALTVAVLGGVTVVLGALRPLAPVAESADAFVFPADGADHDASGETLSPVTEPAEQADDPSEQIGDLVKLPANVTGQVLSAEGKPIGRARVEVSLLRPARGFHGANQPPLHRWRSETNAQGQFVLDARELEPVPARAQFYVDSVIAEGYAEGSGSYSLGARAAARGESLAPITLAPGRRVTGRVVTPDGQPPRNALVRMAGSGGDSRVWIPSPSPCAADGTFAIDVALGLDIEVVAHADGFAPKRAALAQGQSQLGDIVLERGTSLTGRVLQADGTPVAGTIVALESVQRGELKQVSFTTTFAAFTNSAGEFRLPPMVGACQIWVTKAAYPSNRLDRDAWRADSAPPPLAPRIVELKPGDAEQSIELRGGPTLHFAGTVRWGDGTPVSGVDVIASVLLEKAGSGIQLSETITNSLGQYSFELPNPLPGATISVFGSKDAQGIWHMAYPATTVAARQKSAQFLVFTRLESDVVHADWELRRHEEPPAAKPKSSAAREMEKISERYQKQLDEYLKALQAATTSEQQLTISTTMDPRELFAADYLKFEQVHRGTMEGVMALHSLMRSAASVGNPDTRAARARVEAVARLIAHYLSHEDLDVCMTSFQGGPDVPRAKEFLEKAAAESPHPHVRAEALLNLAKLQHLELQHHDMLPALQLYMKSLESRVPAAMVQQTRERLARLQVLDVEAVRKDAIARLEAIQRDYANVRGIYRVFECHGDLCVTRRVGAASGESARPTYGDQAANRLFALTHLAVGQDVPDITGTDSTGKPFKLRDQRGKVVLLMFSANWCGPCQELYATNRQLVTKFAHGPFQVISIMADQEPGTVAEAVAKGDITWPAIWDGQSGPIATKWCIESWPTMILIDHLGKIRGTNVPPAALEDEVTKLVGSAAS